MAFFTAFTRYITVGEGAFSLAICKYTPNTSKVDTRLSRLAVLLRALNIIYRAISLLILGSSINII